MANNKKDDKNGIKFGNLKKIANLMQSNSDSIYRSTYYSSPDNKQQLELLKKDIDTSIKDIMDNNINNTGEPNISKMYERIFMQTQNSDDINKEFDRIFNDNEFMTQLTTTYLDNRFIKYQDDEIDEIMRYMPKLKEAINTLKDNVLSSDSFNKDFLNISTQLDSSISNNDTFSNNIEELKNKYDLLKLVNDAYEDTSTYGEQFLYVVPYQKAIQRLLNSKGYADTVSFSTGVKEGAIYVEESSNAVTYDTKISEINSSDESFKYNITFDKSNMIRSVVENEYNLNNKISKLNEMSLTEQYMTEMAVLNEKTNNVFDSDIDSGEKLPVHHKFDITLHDELELPEGVDTSSDGLVTRNSKLKGGKVKNMNGCIIKKLKRECVTPIYINDACLGYYYFEFDESSFYQDNYTTYGLNNTVTGLMSNGRSESLDSKTRRDELIKYLASELSKKIDAEFVNNNQDLKKEIYYILKYNDTYFNDKRNVGNIRITYIPPEDIQHIYFNFNEETNRGISDLALSLIPAKLWCAIYITNCLAVMTRSNDKRVYYVKQSVDSNISKTLLKTINEIKKSNFGMRQIENINNVLNITGRFNDYIIPRGADGQSPIDFEVMQGQQIEIKTDLLNLLEESAINPTGVPIELIQNRQSPDYAVQFTMTNSKFLRFVYSRQSQEQNILSKLITKIYNIEYGTTDVIKVTLPPPLFINITNTNQLVQNTTDYSSTVTNIVMADEQDEVAKAIFQKDFTLYNLGSYVNMNIVNNLINKAKQKAEKLKADASIFAGGDEA